MINGALGSGKTSTVQMLQPLVVSSMIFDPDCTYRLHFFDSNVRTNSSIINIFRMDF